MEIARKRPIITYVYGFSQQYQNVVETQISHGTNTSWNKANIKKKIMHRNKINRNKKSCEKWRTIKYKSY